MSMDAKIKIPEKTIEKSILHFLQLKGIFAWKNQSTGIFDPTKKIFRKSWNKFAINGVPDIIGIFKGRPLFIEVKRKGSYPTREQKEFGERAIKEGAIWFVARSIEDVERELGI